MSNYKKTDEELLVAFKSFEEGKLSLGSLVSVIQSSAQIVTSLEDRDLRNALLTADGDIDILIAIKYGEEGFRDMYVMYDDCDIFKDVLSIIEPIKNLLLTSECGG